jgi:hypothetical protein
LREEDRVALKSAAAKFSTNALIGSLAGLALGGFLAFRLRQNRMRMFQAFRATEKPTAVKFADGREEAIPDVTELLRPSTMGDILTYTLFGAGGILLGGETGLLTGAWSAKRSIAQDPESRQRIETAFKSFRVDVLKKEIEMLESGKKTLEL